MGTPHGKKGTRIEMKDDIRIALMGTGFIVEFRSQVYSRLPGVKVVSIMGRDPERTRQLAARNGIGYTATSFEELLAGPGFNVVDICLPNYLHKKFAVLAAKSGKHIICQKPLACNAAEAEEMLAAANKAAVIHCYAENWAYSPDMREIEATIQRGIIGRPLWMRGREAHFGPHTEWFYKKELSGGGALLDMGCHVICVFNKFMGKKAIELMCHAATLHHQTDCEDNAIAVIKYEGGLVGQVEASWTTRGGMAVCFEVWGDEGMITYDRSGLSQPIKVFSTKSTDKYFMEKAESNRGWLFPMVEEYWRYGYYDEMNHFTDCIRRGVEPSLTFRDGLEVNRIIDSAYTSVQTGKWSTIR